MTHPETAFKIFTAEQWSTFLADGVFASAPIDLEDGYIHLSTADQLQGTLDKHFAHMTNLVIAEIALKLLDAPVRWEVSRGGALFPHVYGTIALNAVIGTRSA